jgi:hypothetical protein
MTVADTVVPVREKVYMDKHGRERSIEPDQYLNRIFSYIEKNSKNDPAVMMIESEMAYIFAKSEHCAEEPKGLRENASRDDVELAVIHMYLIIAEIAKIRKVDTIYLKTVPPEDFGAHIKLSPGLE